MLYAVHSIIFYQYNIYVGAGVDQSVGLILSDYRLEDRVSISGKGFFL
jgi:hypothetical protein